MLNNRQKHTQIRIESREKRLETENRQSHPILDFLKIEKFVLTSNQVSFLKRA